MEHTADEGIVVRAGSLDELFARAAWGMFRTLTDPRCVRPAERTDVSVEADDVAGLMVRWLSELNFLCQTQGRLFSRFSVDAVTDTGLTARVWGERIDPARHPVRIEIKAVTFHGLEVVREGGEWRARVLFDV